MRRRWALAWGALLAGMIWLYALVWNLPPIPDWIVFAARIALTVFGLLLLRSAGRSGLRTRIEGLPEADREKLNRIYGRSYLLIGLMFASLAGLLVCSALRPYIDATSYRATAAGLVIVLLVVGALSYRLRMEEARLFGSEKPADLG